MKPPINADGREYSSVPISVDRRASACIGGSSNQNNLTAETLRARRKKMTNGSSLLLSVIVHFAIYLLPF
jgi:hypothetical protein